MSISAAGDIWQELFERFQLVDQAFLRPGGANRHCSEAMILMITQEVIGRLQAADSAQPQLLW